MNAHTCTHRHFKKLSLITAPEKFPANFLNAGHVSSHTQVKFKKFLLLCVYRIGIEYKINHLLLARLILYKKSPTTYCISNSLYFKHPSSTRPAVWLALTSLVILVVNFPYNIVLLCILIQMSSLECTQEKTGDINRVLSPLKNNWRKRSCGDKSH